MTYNLMLCGELDTTRLTAALAGLIGVPINRVDVSPEDAEDRDWSAAVLCGYEPRSGDVRWSLDVYVTEAAQPAPDEGTAAAFLADRLGMPVLYPGTEVLPSSYWVAAPGGLRTRARVDSDVADPALIRIDGVEQPVPALPWVPVMRLPEVIKEHRMATPVTTAWAQSAVAEGITNEDPLWFARDRLGAWESLTVRMATGWPPDGWYPAEYYRDDLEVRDELADMTGKGVDDAFRDALTRIDEAFRAGTRQADDPAALAATLGRPEDDLTTRGWW